MADISGRISAARSPRAGAKGYGRLVGIRFHRPQLARPTTYAMTQNAIERDADGKQKNRWSLAIGIVEVVAMTDKL
jgi:hypothetical protein